MSKEYFTSFIYDSLNQQENFHKLMHFNAVGTSELSFEFTLGITLINIRDVILKAGKYREVK